MYYPCPMLYKYTIYLCPIFLDISTYLPNRTSFKDVSFALYIIYITLHVVMSKITSLWKMQFLKDIVTKLFKNASKALRKIDIKCYRENGKNYETFSHSSVKQAFITETGKSGSWSRIMFPKCINDIIWILWFL